MATTKREKGESAASYIKRTAANRKKQQTDSAKAKVQKRRDTLDTSRKSSPTGPSSKRKSPVTGKAVKASKGLFSDVKVDSIAKKPKFDRVAFNTDATARKNSARKQANAEPDAKDIIAKSKIKTRRKSKPLPPLGKAIDVATRKPAKPAEKLVAKKAIPIPRKKPVAKKKATAKAKGKYANTSTDYSYLDRNTR